MSQSCNYCHLFNDDASDVSYESCSEVIMNIISKLLTSNQNTYDRKTKELSDRLQWYQEHYGKLSSKYCNLKYNYESIKSSKEKDKLQVANGDDGLMNSFDFSAEQAETEESTCISPSKIVKLEKDAVCGEESFDSPVETSTMPNTMRESIAELVTNESTCPWSDTPVEETSCNAARRSLPAVEKVYSVMNNDGSICHNEQQNNLGSLHLTNGTVPVQMAPSPVVISLTPARYVPIQPVNKSVGFSQLRNGGHSNASNSSQKQGVHRTPNQVHNTDAPVQPIVLTKEHQATERKRLARERKKSLLRAKGVKTRNYTRKYEGNKCRKCGVHFRDATQLHIPVPLSHKVRTKNKQRLICPKDFKSWVEKYPEDAKELKDKIHF